ncbi:MAG: sce7725 family protein [Dorea sp.]|nr:sce7725 family protein [Dorea sp.]
MYYPYFRGRQNELLCLREMLEDNKLSNKIIPVLEPVKCSSTFFATVKKFIEYDRTIILIKNPAVGKFAEEYNQIAENRERETEQEKRGKLEKTLKEYKEILKNNHIFIAYLVNDRIINKVLEKEEDFKKKIYLINRNRGDDNYYIEHSRELNVKASFIPKDEDFKDEVVGDTIILEDCYEKAKRNVDYIAKPDEFFSKNHLIFKKRGYQGFSDYSIVGNGYEESGFAPLAIAIHIVYLGDKNELRVHHFVSDSNANISDPARKFGEAMEKLVNWDRLEKVEKTKGLMGLINYYENGKFPGLGMIKKFSLMHHVELMGKYLEDSE